MNHRLTQPVRWQVALQQEPRCQTALLDQHVLLALQGLAASCCCLELWPLKVLLRLAFSGGLLAAELAALHLPCWDLARLPLPATLSMEVMTESAGIVHAPDVLMAEAICT